MSRRTPPRAVQDAPNDETFAWQRAAYVIVASRQAFVHSIEGDEDVEMRSEDQCARLTQHDG